MNRSFAHFRTKYERFPRKSNERIPSPDSNPIPVLILHSVQYSTSKKFNPWFLLTVVARSFTSNNYIRQEPVKVKHLIIYAKSQGKSKTFNYIRQEPVKVKHLISGTPAMIIL